MNLVSADTQKLMDFVVYFNAVWVAPIEIALCFFFLWQVRTDASKRMFLFILLLQYVRLLSCQEKKCAKNGIFRGTTACHLIKRYYERFRVKKGTKMSL